MRALRLTCAALALSAGICACRSAGISAVQSASADARACRQVRETLARPARDSAYLEALRGVTACVDAQRLVLDAWRTAPESARVLRMLYYASQWVADDTLLRSALAIVGDTARAPAVRLTAAALAAAFVAPHAEYFAVPSSRTRDGYELQRSWIDHPALRDDALATLEVADSIVAVLTRAADGAAGNAIARDLSLIAQEVQHAAAEPGWRAYEFARRTRLAERAAGCYALTLGPWPTGERPAYTHDFELPQRITLSTERDRMEFTSGSRRLQPTFLTAGTASSSDSVVAKGTWWAPGPDTIVVAYSGNHGALLVYLAFAPTELRGRARAISRADETEVQTTAHAERVSCPRAEELEE